MGKEDSSSTYCSRARPASVRSVCLGHFIVILTSGKRVSAASVGSWYQCWTTLTVQCFFLISGWNFSCCHLCPWPLGLWTNVSNKAYELLLCMMVCRWSCKNMRTQAWSVCLLMIIFSHSVLLIILPKWWGFHPINLEKSKKGGDLVWWYFWLVQTLLWRWRRRKEAAFHSNSKHAIFS